MLAGAIAREASLIRGAHKHPVMLRRLMLRHHRLTHGNLTLPHRQAHLRIAWQPDLAQLHARLRPRARAGRGPRQSLLQLVQHGLARPIALPEARTAKGDRRAHGQGRWTSRGTVSFVLKNTPLSMR